MFHQLISSSVMTQIYPGTKKLIFKRGVKYLEHIQNYTKQGTSVMCCGTATDYLLESYIVYKAGIDEKLLVHPEPGTIALNVVDLTMSVSIIGFYTIFLPWSRNKEGPKVVIGDNLLPEVIQLCEENNIWFVCHVLISTHLWDPLDVAFYGSMKGKWRKILEEWKMKNQSLNTLLKRLGS